MFSNKYTPVIIFAFNRPDNVYSLLKSLSECDARDYTDVYIYIDGYRNKAEKKVVDRTYFACLEYINCFKTLKIIRRNKNLGLASSLKSGISEVFNSHERVIVLEDDLIVSRDFLTYMNQALEFYENDKRIGSVSGFTTKLNYTNKYDNYFHPRPCSWGWGTWKNRWCLCDWSYTPTSWKQRVKLRFKSYSAGQDVYRMYLNQLNRKINSWAIIWAVNHLINSLYVVYPMESKVKNIGFGDRGTHCKGVNPFPTNFVNSKKINFKFDSNVHYEKIILKQINYFHSNVYKILFKLGLK